MRKYAVSGAFALCLSLTGCQVFTAGENVAEPNPAQVRAERSAGESAKVHQREMKGKLTKQEGEASDHGRAPRDAVHGFAGDREAQQVESATASHILIRYEGALRAAPDVKRNKEQARKLAQDIVKKAQRKDADFAKLANQYTEDPSGRGRGGSLGTFARGRMVPEFDKATFELAPGGTSGVVETAFGFHVIHREK